MSHHVFISYSSKDATTAKAVCQILEQKRINCWIAPRDIKAGQKYVDVIEESIKSATVFILVFSKYAQRSDWVKSELNVAFNEKCIIIPFKIDETKEEGGFRLMLSDKQWIEAYPIPEKEFDRLIKAVISFLLLEENENYEESKHGLSHIDKRENTGNNHTDQPILKLTPFDNFKLGETAYKEGFLDLAINHFENVVLNDPKQEMAHFYLGLSHEAKGNKQNAIDAFQKSISINPSFAESYYHLGLSYENNGDSNKAIEMFEKSVKIKPDFAEAYKNLGLLFIKEYNYWKFINAFENYTSIVQTDAEAFHKLGSVYLEMRFKDKVINSYLKALTITFKPFWLFEINQFLLKRGRHVAHMAIEFYQKLISSKPDSYELYKNLGLFYALQFQYKNSIDSYQRSIFLKPDDAQSYNLLGIAYSKTWNYEKAIEAYQKAISFNPEYAQAYCNIGYSYYQDATSLKENYKNYNSKDVLNKAILAFQRAIEIKPEYEIAFYKLAYAFLRVGQHRKAKKAFQKCILQMPKEIFLEPNEFSDKEIYEMIENCVPSSYEMQLDCHIHLAKWGWGSKQSKQWLINNNKTGETPNEIC